MIKTILAAVALLFVIALVLFPEFRRGLKVLVSGILGVFVKDLAKTPEGAEAVYNEAIEEERELYRKACDVLNKASGEYQSAQKNLAKLQEAKKNIEATCERLVRVGREIDARVRISPAPPPFVGIKNIYLSINLTQHYLLQQVD